MAVTDYGRLRRTNNGQGVQLVLGTDFLKGTNGRIENSHPEEEEVAVRTRGNDKRGNDHVDQVKEGERVAGDNLAHRAGQGCLFNVMGPRGNLCVNVALLESGVGICPHGITSIMNFTLTLL